MANATTVNNERLLYIDNIRWVMVILVLSMHSAVTYSNMSNWYYVEQSNLSYSVTIFFLTYQSVLQSFFMGLLFFISGYFVPQAYDKKGASNFLKDRFKRLGIPLLLYVFIIGPLTEYFISGSWHPNPVGRSFMQEYKYYIIRLRFFGGTGPLWFCQALLLFSLMYTLFRSRYKNTAAMQKSIISNRNIIMLVVVLALSTFLVRVPFPKGTSFYNLQLCYFAQYIIMFMAGIYVRRRKWLKTVSYSKALLWGRITWFGGIVLWTTLLTLHRRLNIDSKYFGGGLHWESMGFCIWEALVCTGVSLYIIAFFRKNFNKQGKLTAFFSNNAFAVYVFHPPVLISLAMLLTNLQWDPVIKFLLLTVLSTLVTFTLSEFVLRRIPLLKKVL